MIILILIVIVAIVIFWNVVRGVIEEKSGEIDNGIFTVSLKIDKKSSSLGENSIITVERNAGKGEIVGIKFTLKNSTGASDVVANYTIINELERRVFNVTAQTTSSKVSNISYVEIYPIVKLDSGKEKIGPRQDSI